MALPAGHSPNPPFVIVICPLHSWPWNPGSFTGRANCLSHLSFHLSHKLHCSHFHEITPPLQAQLTPGHSAVHKALWYLPVRIFLLFALRTLPPLLYLETSNSTGKLQLNCHLWYESSSPLCIASMFYPKFSQSTRHCNFRLNVCLPLKQGSFRAATLFSTLHPLGFVC